MKRVNLYPQKVAGREHRQRLARKRNPRQRMTHYVTARELCFNGLTLTLWTEDTNRLGKLHPDLAFKAYHYAFANSDDKRAEYKKDFWNNQKGTMKKFFKQVADTLMEMYGSNTSPEGRVIVERK